MDLGRCHHEELPAHVHVIDPGAGQLLVQLGLESDRIVGEDQTMHVVVERHRGVAQLSDPIERVLAPRHADLDHLWTEGTQVRDDIHVPGPDVGGALVDAVDGAFDLRLLGFGLISFGVIPVGAQLSGRFLVVIMLLLQPSFSRWNSRCAISSSLRRARSARSASFCSATLAR